MPSSARIDELRSKFEQHPRRYFALLANEYRKSGELDRAISLCREQLAEQRGHMSGNVVFGQALYDAGEVAEARGAFETVLEFDPENLIALRQMGDLEQHDGRIEDAKRWYTRAFQADPSSVELSALIAALDSRAASATETSPIAFAVGTGGMPAAPTEVIDESLVLTKADGSGAVVAPGPEPESLAVGGQVAEPASADAPFVTGTMAELYLRQGFRGEALAMYRQLLTARPDDPTIAARVHALADDSSPIVPDPAAPASDPNPREPDVAPDDEHATEAPVPDATPPHGDVFGDVIVEPTHEPREPGTSAVGSMNARAFFAALAAGTLVPAVVLTGHDVPESLPAEMTPFGGFAFSPAELDSFVGDDEAAGGMDGSPPAVRAAADRIATLEHANAGVEEPRRPC